MDTTLNREPLLGYYRWTGFEFGRILPEQRAALRAHFRELSDDDLRLRFGRALPRAYIERYADTRVFERDIVIVARDAAGRIVGVVEVLPFGSGPRGAAELAMTVSARHRGIGLGSALLERAVHAGRERSIDRLVAQVTADNAPMLGLLRQSRATVLGHGETLLVELPLQPARGLS